MTNLSKLFPLWNNTTRNLVKIILKFWACAPVVNAKDKLEMATGVRDVQGHCLEMQSPRRWCGSAQWNALLKTQRAEQAVVAHLPALRTVAWSAVRTPEQSGIWGETLSRKTKRKGTEGRPDKCWQRHGERKLLPVQWYRNVN